MISLPIEVGRFGRLGDVQLLQRNICIPRSISKVAIRPRALASDGTGAGVPAAPGSADSMLALMEAWSQLSTHLQQRPQPESIVSSGDEFSDGSTDTVDIPWPSLSSGSSNADTSELILSALKLAVRSLSRAAVQQGADGAEVSSNFGGNSSPSTDGPPAGNGSALPAVQRSLTLAVALAELYAAGMPLDGASIAAGIVAEAVDVSALNINTVQAKLGAEVAALVHDVLAVRHAPERTQSYDDARSSALRGWLLSAYDVRAAAIEVVWRWLDLAGPLTTVTAPSSSSNSSSSSAGGDRPQYQQQLLAMEALTIYCPLGHALGLGVCAAGLEDAAFKVLFPSSYASTARQVLPLSSAAVTTLSSCESSLTQALNHDATFSQLAAGVRLLGRAKSLYSIMRKLLRLQDPAAGSRRLGQMFDLLGLRAVVLPREDLPPAEAEAAAVQACYRLQEIAQQLWSPMQGRTKDYISKPKPNGYQSLHSTLVLTPAPTNAAAAAASSSSSSSSDSGSNAVVLRYLELQVRTAAMHAAAEGGDAAHSGYKGRLERRQVRQLQQWTQQLKKRLGAPQPQTLLLTAAHGSSGGNSSSSSSSSIAGDVQPTPLEVASLTSASSSSSSSSTMDDADSGHSNSLQVSAFAEQRQQQQQQQQLEPAAAATAAIELFQHLDLDGDGHLSLYELTVLLQELGVASKQQQPQQQTTLLLSVQSSAAAAAAAVAEGSSQQSPPPPAAAAAAAAATSVSYAQQLLELLDTNGDGLVSLPEFLAYYMTSVSSSSSNSSGGGSSSSSGSHSTLSQPSTSTSSSSSGGSGSGGSATAGSIWSSLHTTAQSAGGLHRPLAATAFAGHLGHTSNPSHRPVAGYPYSSSSSGSSLRAGTLRCYAVRSSSSSSDDNGSDLSSSKAAVTQRHAHPQLFGSSSSSSSSTAVGLLRQPVVAALSAVSASSVDFEGSDDSSSSSSSFVEQGSSISREVAGAFDLEVQSLQLQQQQQQLLSQQLSDLQGDLREQQQRQVLRQQQQQLPTVLEDAAAGLLTSYTLVPVSSSGHSSSEAGRRWQPPLSAISVTNRLGEVLSEIQVPPFGPLVITNAPGLFRSADVSVDVTTFKKDKLLLQLEVVKPSGSDHAVLTARNLSRVVRKLVPSAVFYVNRQPLLPPHGPAAEISAGDVLEFGRTGMSFQVVQQAVPAQHAAVAAVQQYCGLYAQKQLGLQLPVQEAVQQLLEAHAAPLPKQQQQQQKQRMDLPPVVVSNSPPAQLQDVQLQDKLKQQQEKAAAAAAAAAGAAAAADALELQLRNVSRLVRTNPRSAEQQLATLAAETPTAAGPWFLWAQLAAGSKRPSMARELYRAAAVCQQQQMLLQGASDAAAGVVRLLAQQQRQRQQEALAEDAPAAAAVATASSTEDDSWELLQPQPAAAQPAATSSSTVSSNPSSSSSSSDPTASSSGTAAAFRLTSRLIQILRSWGRLEWDQKLFGSARRLWRLVANEAFKFPYEISAGGGGSVLHCWATAEFERSNILNARVIIGEALRKCPRDAAVAVLAGNIEASAGDINTARALFMRAYQLNKADKQLYMAWPKMEGSAGNTDRARALFQAGLSLYPNNTKILNLYACFEEDQGNVELARQLHRNALDIDDSSQTAMHNRVSWAALELRSGNLTDCRLLLREGLDQHPDDPAALLLLAQIERRWGKIDLAEAYARRAQKSDSFSVAAMRELQHIYDAKGEPELSRNLLRHIDLAERREAAKKSGKIHGSTGWAQMFDSVKTGEEGWDVVNAARQRKVELGLIREPQRDRQDTWRAAQQQQQQQRRPQATPTRGHSKLAQQQQQQEPDQLQGFDFSAAVQAVQAEAVAAQQQAIGRRRRAQLKQQQ